MSSSTPTFLSDAFLAPMESGFRAVQKLVTSAAAAQQALFSGLTPVPSGKVYVTFYVATSQAYIRFKAGTSATSITTANGLPRAAGTEFNYYIDATNVTYFEVIADGAGAIYWWVSSPEADNKLGIVASTGA